MNTADNEVVREALINLDRSREKERALRKEANNLLEGLEIITSATDTADMLGRLLKMVTEQLACEDAFILSPLEEEGGRVLNCIGATESLYMKQRWLCGKTFQRVLEGRPVMLFSVARVEEWQGQEAAIQERTGSVLLISFPVAEQQKLLCCVSRTPAYFKKTHMTLMQRLMPIASHALHTLYINEQLQHEIDERNRMEQYASFQAGIAEMSASVLHNIGNTVTGAQGNLLMIERHRKNLFSLARIFGIVSEWFDGDTVNADQIRKTRAILEKAGRLLSDVLGDGGEMQQSLNAMDRSNHHVSEIIQMQRGVSRPVLTATHFAIQEMVDDTLGMIQESIEKRSISVEVNILQPLESLYLPRNPMIQMLLNLVKNSVESIEERKISEPNLSGSISICLTPVGERVELVLEDNGVGVVPEHLTEIFRFGESSKQQGSGFGLHSVANFVKSVQGELHMESEGVNCGARMVVELPQAMEEQRDGS